MPAVYFIQNDDTHLIKIGRVRSPEDVNLRLNSLQRNNPAKLSLLGTIDCSLHYEKRLHQQFSHLRQNGEWFKPDQSLLDFINQAGASWVHPVDTEFAIWLDEELASRGWSHRELARRAGVSQTAVSQAISGQRNVGWDFCAAIAAPLDKEPIEVLVMAGLLNYTPKELDPFAKDLLAVTSRLPEADQREVLNYAHYRLTNHSSERNNQWPLN